MEDALGKHLLDCAAAYVAATGIGESTLAQRAAGDWRFFERLRGTTTFTVRKYDEVMAWFAASWPDGADWPDGVPRPAAAEAVS